MDNTSLIESLEYHVSILEEGSKKKEIAKKAAIVGLGAGALAIHDRDQAIRTARMSTDFYSPQNYKTSDEVVKKKVKDIGTKIANSKSGQFVKKKVKDIGTKIANSKSKKMIVKNWNKIPKNARGAILGAAIGSTAAALANKNKKK